MLVLVLASRAQLPLPWTETGGSSVVQGHAPFHLTPGKWQEIALPVPGSSISSYAADPGYPGRLVLCSDSTAGGLASNSATVWLTVNSGRTWTALPIPTVTSLSCAVSVIADNPTVLLLQAGSSETEPACFNALFYLSTDLGASWRRIPPTSSAPAGSQGVCSIGGSGQHLYVATLYTEGAPPSPPASQEQILGTNGSQYILLERSDDDGRSWQRIALPYQLTEGMDLAPSSNGNILLGDLYGTGAPLPRLWISRNAGDTWSSEGAIAGGATALMAPAYSGTDLQPMPSVLYAVASDDQIPEISIRLNVDMAGPDFHWSVVPPLPIPGARADRTGLTDILGVLPDGRLLALGATPGKSLSGIDIAGQQQWLWLWDPVKMHWESVSTPSGLVWPESCTALCWQAQISSATSGAGSHSVAGYDLYLMGVAADGNQHPLYRLFLPKLNTISLSH
jgi:hypothetical protein